MVRARVHSWIHEYTDEDGTTWDAYLTITMPDGEDIDFEAGFETREEAETWRNAFEELIHGCTVTLDTHEHFSYDPDFDTEKETVCFSQRSHIEALETLVREAYAHLPSALQARADMLLKTDGQVIHAAASHVAMLPEGKHRVSPDEEGDNL